jgi:hypothetical protein
MKYTIILAALSAVVIAKPFVVNIEVEEDALNTASRRHRGHQEEWVMDEQRNNCLAKGDNIPGRDYGITADCCKNIGQFEFGSVSLD